MTTPNSVIERDRMTDPTIQAVARQAAEAVPHTASIHEIRQVADAVAKATLLYTLELAEERGAAMTASDIRRAFEQFDPLVVTQDTDPGSGVK